MNRLQHPFDDNRAYLITTVTHMRRVLFNDAEDAQIVATVINEVVSEERIDVYVYAIMLDHIHLIVDLQERSSLKRTMQLIKGRSSRRLSKERKLKQPIWQKGYHDHGIRNEHDLREKLRYVLDNPRRAGLSAKHMRPPFLWIRDEWQGEMPDC